jgi:hypothetical protein
MNPSLAFSPLIVHIPHAVPVVIAWGVMLRFYLAQRKQKAAQPSTVASVAMAEHEPLASDGRATGVKPAARRVWAVDDAPETGVLEDHHEVPVLGRTPAGRL